MRRSSGLATVLVALSLVFPAAASAGPPDARMPVPSVIYAFDAGMVCPMAVGKVTWSIIDGQNSVLAKPDGRVMAGLGTSLAEVASAATGKSVVLKIAGAGTTSFPPDGSMLMHNAGMTIWGFYPGDAGPGDRSSGRSYLMAGSQRAVNTAQGATVEFSYSGQILMDVCAAIS
jgi:hypothetical protein